MHRSVPACRARLLAASGPGDIYLVFNNIGSLARESEGSDFIDRFRSVERFYSDFDTGTHAATPFTKAKSG